MARKRQFFQRSLRAESRRGGDIVGAYGVKSCSLQGQAVSPPAGRKVKGPVERKTMSSSIIFIGVKAHVVAVDRKTGGTLWKTKLKGGLTSGERFVTLLVEGGCVYAHTYGELFCLDETTGEILWRNALEGLGYDIASLATAGAASPAVAALASLKKKQTSESGAVNAASGGR
jgi:outer membrane protein assembly factor BamB